MNRREMLWLIGAAAAGPAMAGAPTTAPLPVPRRAPRPPTTADLIDRYGASGEVGWALRDLDSGALVDGHQADRGFVPASVAKLPTAFYALATLGPEHRFRTRLLASGEIRDGMLDGDLCLSGGGDPELDTDALVPMVQALTAAGIRGVTGRFLIDGSALPLVPAIEPDQPVDAGYNPSVSGLMMNYNRVRLSWDMRGNRRTATLTAEAQRLKPDVQAIGLSLTDDRAAPPFDHTLRDGAEHWVVRRSILRGKGGRWLPVRQPLVYAGDVFRTVAETFGITLPSPTIGPPPETAREIAAHESRPLLRILRDMLRYSTNLTAEAVGLAATRQRVGTPADLAASATAMNDWASELSGGALPAFSNHSGLSLDARVSPLALTAFLAGLATRSPGPGGATGTLPAPMADLLSRTGLAVRGGPKDPATLEIVVKTGTMTYVRGLSGYLATPDGRRLAFAIFSNDLPRRGPGIPTPNRGWTGRARSFERALLATWSGIPVRLR